MPIQKKTAIAQAVHHCKPLTDCQLSQILALTEKDPQLNDIHDLVTIIVATGMRSRELRDLRWADLDLAKRKITIKQGTFDVRTIRLEDEALRGFERRRLSAPLEEYVFGASPQRLLNRASRKLATISSGINIDRVSLYSLRMTYINRLINSGASIGSIMRMMGCRVLLRAAFRVF